MLRVLAFANSKQLTMCACRFSLLLDMIDLLDVRLHDPEASFRQFTDTAQTADYAGVPLLKEELDNLTCLSVHDLVLALEKNCIAAILFSGPMLSGGTSKKSGLRLSCGRAKARPTPAKQQPERCPWHWPGASPTALLPKPPWTSRPRSQQVV